MKIYGYSASDSKSGDKRYLSVEVISKCEPGYRNGSAKGMKTVQLDAEPSLENLLKNLNFPIDVEVTHDFKEIRTEYGTKMGVYITDISAPATK